MRNLNSLKKLGKTETWYFAFIAFLSVLNGTSAFAQNSVPDKVDVDINAGSDAGGGGWYAQPWVWVVGVAVFIIIIVAITRSGNSRREI